MALAEAAWRPGGPSKAEIAGKYEGGVQEARQQHDAGELVSWPGVTIPYSCTLRARHVARLSHRRLVTVFEAIQLAAELPDYLQQKGAPRYRQLETGQSGAGTAINAERPGVEASPAPAARVP